MFNLFKKYSTQILCVQWGSNIAFSGLISTELCDRGYTVTISDAELMIEIEKALQYKVTSPKEWIKIKKHLINKLICDFHVQVISTHDGLILYYYLGKN